MSILIKNYFCLFSTDKFEKHQISGKKHGFHDVLGMVFIPHPFLLVVVFCLVSVMVIALCLVPAWFLEYRDVWGSAWGPVRAGAWGVPGAGVCHAGTCHAPLCHPSVQPDLGTRHGWWAIQGSDPLPSPAAFSAAAAWVFHYTSTCHPGLPVPYGSC